MFHAPPDLSRPSVAIELDGATTHVPDGWSVATALLASGVGPFRTSSVSGAPRAPYCMMGVCFECLVEIDGVPNQQGCMVPVREGMRVRRQRGAPKAGGA